MSIKNTPYDQTPLPMPDSSPLPPDGFVPTVPDMPTPAPSLGQKIKTAASDFWFWLTAPRWHLVVLVLDNIDRVEKADIPLKEVARFLKQESRFYLSVTYRYFNDAHEYYGPFGPEHRYDLYWSVLPQKWLAQIPPCSAVLALYKLNGKLPVHAGSTWALRDGININGKLRPWAAIPTDLWFYVNDPIDLFRTWAGQICTHEIVNTIRGKVESDPYRCVLSDAPGATPWKYETARVRLQDSCYDSLGNNED